MLTLSLSAWALKVPTDNILRKASIKADVDIRQYPSHEAESLQKLQKGQVVFYRDGNNRIDKTGWVLIRDKVGEEVGFIPILYMNHEIDTTIYRELPKNFEYEPRYGDYKCQIFAAPKLGIPYGSKISSRQLKANPEFVTEINYSDISLNVRFNDGSNLEFRYLKSMTEVYSVRDVYRLDAPKEVIYAYVDPDVTNYKILFSRQDFEIVYRCKEK